MDKILIVCQSDNLSKKICFKLSEKFNFMVLNIDDYIKYELYNKEDIENILGIDYYKSKEVKIVSNISSFENCIIEVSPKTFLQDRFNEVIKNMAHTIYIKVTKEYLENEINLESDLQIKNVLKINLIPYKEVNELLQKNVNETILYSKNELDENEINKVINQISF